MTPNRWHDTAVELWRDAQALLFKEYMPKAEGAALEAMLAHIATLLDILARMLAIIELVWVILNVADVSVRAPAQAGERISSAPKPAQIGRLTHHAAALGRAKGQKRCVTTRQTHT